MTRKTPIRRLAVLGLGKLGSCIAATFASRGFEVHGFDIDPKKVRALTEGRAPVEEPRLQETMEAAGSRLRGTHSLAEAVRDSEAAFLVPATPSLPDGSFSNEYVLLALRAVAQEVAAQGKSGYLFVVNSTVTPCSCMNVFKPLLEELLRGRCGEDFGLCYNPEFIALGDVIHGLLQPDFVLIGESDPRSGAWLEDAYRRLCLNSPPVARMSLINAELAKISVNCAVTMRVSFVNQLSAVCGKIPGADPQAILQAIGHDRRIGHAYLKPGLGYGGPCFPRDNRLFQYTARSVGVDAPLAEATDRVNEEVNQRLLDAVLAHSPPGTPVAILGLAYKPNTNVIDCSPGIWLGQRLAEQGRQVLAHDYAAKDNAARTLTNGMIKLCAQPDELFQPDCRTFVITCPWPAYRDVFKAKPADSWRAGTVVIDPWRMVSDAVSHLKNVRVLATLF